MTYAIIENKQQIREEALAARDSLPMDWRIEASLKMAKYADEIEFSPQEIISGFLPIRSEVDLRPLMHNLRQAGAQLCLPDIVNRETLVFRNFTNETELREAEFGTLVPAADEPVLDPTIMLVPLSGYDKNGSRLGYGGGYYDRSIKRLHEKDIKPLLIGIGFSCQEVERVPMEHHDVRMDRILTEKGFVL
jgi:5-formyltetrahydrofolate cyclo-ligase